MKKQELFNNATGKIPYQRQPGQMGKQTIHYHYEIKFLTLPNNLIMIVYCLFCVTQNKIPFLYSFNL